VASQDSDDESEDEDGDVELIDISANETGDSSDQDIYRLRVGNFSESIQVMKLPYSSRYASEPIPGLSALGRAAALSHSRSCDFSG
jgi:hypothetical protein